MHRRSWRSLPGRRSKGKGKGIRALLLPLLTPATQVTRGRASIAIETGNLSIRENCNMTSEYARPSLENIREGHRRRCKGGGRGIPRRPFYVCLLTISPRRLSVSHSPKKNCLV